MRPQNRIADIRRLLIGTADRETILRVNGCQWTEAIQPWERSKLDKWLVARHHDSKAMVRVIHEKLQYVHKVEIPRVTCQVTIME